MNPEIEIVAHGPSGVVHYREGPNSHAFDWELGGGDVIVSIYVPAPDEWDARVPWAAGRRAEILERLVSAVRRKQSLYGRVEILDRWINFREPRAPWTLVGAWLARLKRRR